MKSISEMTTEELLEAVGTTADLKTPEKKCQVSEFILEFNIKPGKHSVPNYLIFHTYMTAWRPRSEKKLSKIGFFRKFNKFFTATRVKNNRQYLLDDTTFIKMREDNEKAKGFNKRYDKKRSKKAQQKRRGEVSGTGEKIQLKDED